MQRIKNTKIIGNNLRRIRLAHGMTQDDVARQLQLQGYDISLNYYTKYELSILHIRPDILVALTKIFNCKLEDFFEGIEPQKDEE